MQCNGCRKFTQSVVNIYNYYQLNQLFAMLTSSIKPHILLCIQNMNMAIEHHFGTYYEITNSLQLIIDNITDLSSLVELIRFSTRSDRIKFRCRFHGTYRNILNSQVLFSKRRVEGMGGGDK